MQRITTLLVLLLIAALSGNAQTMFQVNLGGTTIGNINVSQKTTDGGYVFGGFSESIPYDYFLIKMDSVANITWTKTYGTASGSERLNDMIQTNDGGYMMAGFSSVSFNYDMYFIKTDASGDTVFTRSFGGYRSESANTIVQTSDGGFLAAGSFTDNSTPPNTSLLLYKMDAFGDSLWTTILNAPGATSGEVARSVKQTTDGGYIIGGEYSFGQFQRDAYLIKIDSVGTVLWNKTYQLAGGALVANVVQTTDDGFILGGNYVPPGGINNKLFLIRTNSIGDTLWTSTYGGQYLDEGGWVQQTTDGGFIQCGHTESFGATSGGDGFLQKITPNGVVSWSYRYGGNQPDQFSSVSQTADQGYISAGSAASFGTGYLYIVKTDSLGNSNCSQFTASSTATHPPVSMNTTVLSILNPGAWVSVPVIDVGTINGTAHTICLTVTGINENDDTATEVTLYPNPTADMIYIKSENTDFSTMNFELTNTLGQKILVGSYINSDHVTQIDLQGINSGIYFLSLVGPQSTHTYRVIKQ